MIDPATYTTLATEIIRSQSMVIGPLAFDQAKQVNGITVDESLTVSITGEGREVLHNLVIQSKGLFGQASVEMCKDAIRELHMEIDPKDLPEILR